MNASSSGSAVAPDPKAREVWRWFCLSCLMFVIPIAEVWWFFSAEARPLWLPNVLWLLCTLWLASGVAGLLFAVRSCHLADRESDGFGICAGLLHIGSLCFLWFWA